MKVRKHIYSAISAFLLLIVCLQAGLAQSIPWEELNNHPWVDSVFNELTPSERLAQTFMVATYSNRSSDYENELLEYVADNRVGGVIFFQGGPQRQANLHNRLQEKSMVPLLVAMDAEWGLGMRLDSTYHFPYQMTLGAVQDPHLIYETGRAMARHCKRLGVHINFAPVLDVNNNPQNPVINFRSFGENRDEVRWRGFELINGLQDGGVMAVAKHFPGHGDTDVDSHLDLPVIKHSRMRLDSIELFPFRFAIKNGVGGIMVAHLNIPALDPTGKATTLSKDVVDGLLKKQLGFEGLVFTDALNMEGVAKDYVPGEVDLAAFLAGNDVLLFSEDVPRAMVAFRNAIREGLITQEDIDLRCRKVLAAKLWAGLDKDVFVETDKLTSHLNTHLDDFLNIQLSENAITVLENKNEILPLRDLSNLKIASVSIGSESLTSFQESLALYTKMDHHNIGMGAKESDFAELLTSLDEYDLVIVGLHKMGRYPRNNFSVSDPAIDMISQLSLAGRCITSIFGNPYLLDHIENVEKCEALLVGYEGGGFMERAAAEVIFGGISSPGKLPVSIGDKYSQGAGLHIEGGLRFEYTLPEEVGIAADDLTKIDSIVRVGLDQKAMPGCQVLVAKDGKVIYHKTFGKHTYEGDREVQKGDLYDLASVTKISGALPAVMKLYEEGKFDLDATFGTYLPYFSKGNKKDLTFREILAHQSGMLPWISYWQMALKGNAKYPWAKGWSGTAINDGNYKRNTFDNDSSAKYPIKVDENLYLHKSFKNKMFKAIRKSPLGAKEYKYSGLLFYVLPEIVEKLSGEDYHSYVYGNFYHPLGAYNITYSPQEHHQLDQVVPTELDTFFRKRQIHGYVHDEGASMMNKKSSNAGLFANATDLAKLIQMYVEMGQYGGERYLKESTIKEFSRCQYCEEGNRRGLGFDKPLAGDDGNRYPARSASASSFGHSGFTGNFAWADPEYGLVYIFLSNRVYTTRANSTLYDLNIRTDIQQVVYDALGL